MGHVGWMGPRSPSLSVAQGAWRFPFAPHDLSADKSGSEKVLFWLQFADFYRFPHVVFFEGAVGLLRDVLTSDINAVSKQMRRYHANKAEISGYFYRDTVIRILRR